MSTPRSTPPVPASSYATEVLETRARADENDAGQAQSERGVAQQEQDELERLRRHVVRPLREHLPGLVQRPTAQLLSDGVAPAELLSVPPDVLREAAEWAASAPSSALGDDLLNAERTVLRAHERLAEQIHAILADVAARLARARQEVGEQVDQMEANGTLAPGASVPAMDDEYQLAVTQLERLARLQPILLEVLAMKAQASHRTQRFFLAASDAIALATNRFESGQTLAEKQRIGDILLHVLNKPLRKL